MTGKVLSYVREHGLLKPGDRVGVAVSGGADSVALLRVLLGLRDQLGIVPSVLHFNHQIRGSAADEDERFVAALAGQHGLEFHRSSADVPAYAAEHKVTVETAGREARYRFFESLLERDILEAVATGHTMDDQAETVLMRVLRGAGVKGLGGIRPRRRVGCAEPPRSIVRPLLEIRRSELRAYLESLGQPWREDATNADLQYTRNRIRHGLIPLIETRFQPAAVPALAQIAEVAREEEDYWHGEVRRIMPELVLKSAGGLSVDCSRLVALHPALERRILRECAHELNVTLNFEHLMQLLAAAADRDKARPAAAICELPGGWRVVREPGQLRFERQCSARRPAPLSYRYRLPIPGEVEIVEVGRVVHAFLRPVKPAGSGYNPEQSLDAAALGAELVVRNWQPGDRLWPVHSKGPKKMKELFEQRHVPASERRLWPVAVSGERLVWARGFGASAEFQPAGDARQVVVVEEHVLHHRQER